MITHTGMKETMDMKYISSKSNLQIMHYFSDRPFFTNYFLKSITKSGNSRIAKNSQDFFTLSQWIYSKWLLLISILQQSVKVSFSSVACEYIGVWVGWPWLVFTKLYTTVHTYKRIVWICQFRRVMNHKLQQPYSYINLSCPRLQYINYLQYIF